MSDWLDEHSGKRTGVVTIPTLWLALVLSLMIHVAVLWKWLPDLRLHLPTPEDIKRGEGSLVVRIAPPPSPPPSPPSAPPSPASRAQPSPALKPQPPKAAPAPRAAPPPPIALKRPAPDIPSPPPAVPPVAAPPRAPADGDLASYVEARRRARAEPAPEAPPAAPAFPSGSNTPPVEDEKTRANRIAAANLSSERPRTFGFDPSRGGGIFTIKRLHYDNAEFIFYGWNKNVERNTMQLIEVRRGNNSDIRIAVVRKMIAIIREYEREDFLWESKRLSRNLTLSARARDNAGLEEFMMREFFDDPQRPQ